MPHCSWLRLSSRGSQACFLAALCAGANRSDALWGLKFQVSVDGGVNWRSSVTALPGQTIDFRFGCYCDETTFIASHSGTGVALTPDRFTGQNKVEGLGAGDVITDLTVLVPSHGSLFTTVTGNLIGSADIRSFGLNIFPGGIPIMFDVPYYTGKIVVSPLAGPHHMTIMNSVFGAGANAGLTFWSSVAPANKESGVPTDYPSHTDITADIEVIPTPSPALAFAVSVAFANARRRKH